MSRKQSVGVYRRSSFSDDAKEPSPNFMNRDLQNGETQPYVDNANTISVLRENHVVQEERETQMC